MSATRYASTTSSQPGPYDYEYRSESAGVKTLLIPYSAGHDSVVVAIKGASPGTSSFSLDVWIDVFAGVTSESVTLSETSAPGTSVFAPQVFAGVSLVYSISSGNVGNAFAIDTATGAVTVGSDGLDYESQQSFTLRIAGVNPQQTCLSGYMDIHVQIQDVNDNTPTFAPFPSAVAVNEDAPVGTLVIQLMATDADASSTITYSMASISRHGRRQTGAFVVNSTGAVLTNTLLDPDTQDSYSLTVLASDGTNSATASFQVQVQNVMCTGSTWSVDGTYPCSSWSPACGPTEVELSPPSSTADRMCVAAPTAVPTHSPTYSPTHMPTPGPTTSPTFSPTFLPTNAPTFAPTNPPTFVPTTSPTFAPTPLPTTSPTYAPTPQPSTSPTFAPTAAPVATPTTAPSFHHCTDGSSLCDLTTTFCQVRPDLGINQYSCTCLPGYINTGSTTSCTYTSAPTAAPSFQPTDAPTTSPTFQPSFAPTSSPTFQPSFAPTIQPTEQPSFAPTMSPTLQPSPFPTMSPTVATMSPTVPPSTSPTAAPTKEPTAKPILAKASDSSSSSAESGILVAAILAGLLALLLVAMFVRHERSKRESPEIADNPTFISTLTHGEFSLSPAMGVAIKRVADPSITPAALTQRGDRLWADFRRCIAFDNQYFGNDLLALNDTQLEDVYAILAMTCPTRTFFGPLREVGRRFCSQKIKNVENDDVLIDDLVDFIARAMPDVLMERAIDICGMDAPPPEEDIYQMMDDYVSEENAYLAPDSSCRGLRSDAAHRELHQVDPLYYEPDEEESEYAVLAEYAMARDRPVSDVLYDAGMAGHAIYDSANGAAAANRRLSVEATYGLASNGDVVYVAPSPVANASMSLKKTLNTADSL